MFRFFLLPILLLSSLWGDESPLLARVWTPDVDPAGWYMSEKYDGVRGIWDGRTMRTRNGTPIPLPHGLEKRMPPFPLDGELWAGRGNFAAAQALLHADGDPKAWEGVRYMVFEVPEAPGPFMKRIAFLELWRKTLEAPFPEAVEQRRCQGEADLRAFLARVEEQGGEGVMLRRAGSAPGSGRNGDLLKVKSYMDDEAVVVGHNPGQGKYEGMTGSLLVEWRGLRFSVGSGLTDALRKNPPPPGTLVTFKYWGLTNGGKPRFPVFWRVRKEK